MWTFVFSTRTSRSPRWTLMCMFKQYFWAKVAEQKVHEYGRSFVCVLMWEWRCAFFTNAMEQVEHLCRFIPSWRSRCSLRYAACAKVFWHKLHWWSFDICWTSVLVCVSRCRFICCKLVHTSGQCLHLICFLWWLWLMCICGWNLAWNSLGQYPHLKLKPEPENKTKHENI